MNAVTLHDGFVGAGCEGQEAPQPAVTIEAGAPLPARERRQVAQAAWYRKPQPTFSDALAVVR